MNTTTRVMSLTPTKPFTHSSPQFPSSPPQHLRPLRSLSLIPIKSRITTNATTNDGGNTSPPPPPPITPPDAVEIRFRRGSRRKSRQQDGGPKKAEQKGTVATKDWESMSMTEKAIELYMGEKGLLFWINKLAYACIFIVIGAWILFRFVGPALNLYQLDSAPLSPTSIFKS
ncbi:hypothetical protein ACSBR2_024719 [Camellia fascicularis]